MSWGNNMSELRWASGSSSLPNAKEEMDRRRDVFNGVFNTTDKGRDVKREPILTASSNWMDLNTTNGDLYNTRGCDRIEQLEPVDDTSDTILNIDFEEPIRANVGVGIQSAADMLSSWDSIRIKSLNEMIKAEAAYLFKESMFNIKRRQIRSKLGIMKLV